MSDPTGDEMSGVAVRMMSDPMSEMAIATGGQYGFNKGMV